MERLWYIAWIALCCGLTTTGCGSPGEEQGTDWQLVDEDPNNATDDNNDDDTAGDNNADNNDVGDNNDIDANNDHTNNDHTNNGSNNVANNVIVTTRVPLNHRPAEVTCDNERAPGLADPDPGVPASCLADIECTEGVNGRCIGNGHDGYYCTYDECFADADCGGNVCGCGGGFRSDHNICMSGNCAIDSDCGPGGFCSPSFSDCGNYFGVVAYFCHTPQDECIDDADCGADGGDPWGSYCMFDEGVGHWTCSNSQCAG